MASSNTRSFQLPFPAIRIPSKIIFLFLAALLLPPGCAGKTAVARNTLSENGAAAPFPKEMRITTAPYSRLDGIPTGPGVRPSVEVRMASAAELAEVPGIWKEAQVAAYSGLGLGALGLGLTAPPVFASGLIVYGVMMVTIAPSIGAYEGLQRNVVQNALKETDLACLTRNAIAGALDAGEAEIPKDPQLTLIILAYGFTEGNAGICFSVDAELILQNNGEQIYRDFIYMEPFLRSRDAPPPQCASLADFSDDDGKLAKIAIRDSSLILSSIVRHRLPGLKWKTY